jgi:ferredoxin-NADP reductase
MSQDHSAQSTDPAGESTSVVLVKQMTFEADGVLSVTLVSADGGELPTWEPGAHVDLVLPSGLIRQYSLCGKVEDRASYRLGVLRETSSRGGSKEIHEQALIGRKLVIRGPRNHFPLAEVDSVCFLAGGIGITPMIPMIAEAQRRGVDFHIVYGGRGRKSMAFLDELSQYGDRLRVIAEDEEGMPDLASILGEFPSATAVYACGPPGMLAAVEECCSALGRSHSLHLERFSAPPPDPSPEIGEVGPFDVELGRQNVRITVPAGQTLLRALREVVPSILYSCEEGYCGTCEVKVLDGVPDHRDTILTDEERESNKTVMVCVSRSKSPLLVLDV